MAYIPAIFTSLYCSFDSFLAFFLRGGGVSLIKFFSLIENPREKSMPVSSEAIYNSQIMLDPASSPLCPHWNILDRNLHKIYFAM